MRLLLRRCHFGGAVERNMMSSLMRQSLPWLFGLSLLAVSKPSFAANFAGQTSSGAYYQIETPANWLPGNGLVLINHGYTLDRPSANPSLGETALRNRMLQQGYAIAASSYSDSGWAVFRIGQDYRELMQEFRRLLGEPGPILAAGGSLGGLVSIQLAELGARGEFDAVNGVLALCPAVAGAKTMDQAFDVRVSYDVLCEGTTGGSLPSSSVIPYLLKPEDVSNGADELATVEVAAAGARCLGMGVNDLLQTSGMRERRARFLAINGGTEDAIPSLLYYASFGISDLVWDPLKLAGVPGFSNSDVSYGDTQVDARVRRVSAGPIARYQFEKNYTPSGRIGNAKLLAITTSADPITPVQHLSILDERFPANNTRRALVKEVRASHCGFSDAELVGAWNALSDWTRGRTALNTGALVSELSSACEAARIGGPQGLPGASGECRFATADNLPPSNVFKARPKDGPIIDSAIDGDWFNPSRSGEGIKMESLGDGRTLVTVFTYPRTGDDAEQLWLTGVGVVSENGFSADLIETRGARFGDAFQASAVQRLPWGRLDIALSDCGRAQMQLTGPVGYGQQTHDLVQLTRSRVPCFSRIAQPAFTALSGNWYDPARSGEGLALTVQPDRVAYAIWFTYTPDAKQAWIAQGGQLVNNRIEGEAIRPTGARFGSAFNASDVRRDSFGRFSIEVISCSEIRLNYLSPWGSGTRVLRRLTTPEASAGCALD
jgi:hypothetical protein